jgi:Tfp pilus assembly protein PilO
MIWREKRILLIILGLLLAANTIFFFTYRVQYESRLRDLDSSLQQSKSELDAARRARVGAEQQIAAYRRIEKDVREVYDTRWSTEGARLTSLIGEVKKTAAASQLEPKTFSFQHAASKGTAKTAGSSATEVGIGFNVEGTYDQVRRLINLLELSEQFIIIDQISLASAQNDRLTLTIHMKTLFRDTSAPPKASNQES